MVNVLQKGGLVIMPTETLYGVFVDATNSLAVDVLVRYKARPFGKPFSVAVNGLKMASEYVILNGAAKKIYKKFLPGPLTVVSKGKHKVAPGIESESGTLGVRVPDYPFLLNVIKRFGKPITATSANASYKKRPYKINDILENVSKKQKSLIDLIVDAGELPHNEPSTVIDTTFDDPTILRQGNIRFSKSNKILSTSEESTMNLAKELWQKYEPHKESRAIVFALEGLMGAGKTIFAKGLGRAMGIKEDVISPTYDLEHEYKIRNSNIEIRNGSTSLTISSSLSLRAEGLNQLKDKSQITNNNFLRLVHIDLWRMFNATDELKNLGTQNQINDKSVIAIEWADKAADYIRNCSEEAIVVWIKVQFGKKENERIIEWRVL